MKELGRGVELSSGGSRNSGQRLNVSYQPLYYV
jgi:hypothetical protein